MIRRKDLHPTDDELRAVAGNSGPGFPLPAMLCTVCGRTIEVADVRPRHGRKEQPSGNPAGRLMRRLLCLLGHRWSPWRNEVHSRVRWRDGKPYKLVIARRRCERCSQTDSVTLRGGAARPSRAIRLAVRVLRLPS